MNNAMIDIVLFRFTTTLISNLNCYICSTVLYSAVVVKWVDVVGPTWIQTKR